MTETQQSIAKWARETFPGGDDLSPAHALRMLDEAIELCLVIGCTFNEMSAHVSDAFNQSVIGPNTSIPNPAYVAAELADVAICLDVMAERRGIGLRVEVDRKMAINRARRWQSNGDGTGRHIKD